MYLNKKAFTLIELLVVVLIIGILAAIALPQYQVVVLKSQLSTVIQNVRTLKQAEETYYMINGEYTPDLGKLDISISGCTLEADVRASVSNGKGVDLVCKNNKTAYQHVNNGGVSEIIGIYSPNFYTGYISWGRIVYRDTLDKGNVPPKTNLSRCRIDNASDKIAAKVCDSLGRKIGAQDWAWQ
jgi:prepilin-type N-terminal cleavage/methylation domain-containing protein